MLGMEQVSVRDGARWLAAVLGGVLLVAFVGHGIAQAQGATINVNSYEDAHKSNDGICTLREAIISANNDRSGDKPDECESGSGHDTILIPPGTYVLSRSDNGNENSSNTGDLDIDNSVTIASTGPGLVVIDASGISDRVFHILNGSVSIRGVTILGGTIDANGGGIMVESGATLTVQNVTLTGNAADGAGGAIYVDGSAELTNVTISQNTAANGSGAGASGSLTLHNTIIADDSCSGSIATTGANLLHNAAGCPTGSVSGDPLLDWSVMPGIFMLQAESPAIGAAIDGCPATDQLGQPRPAVCDLGAHEYSNEPPVADPDGYTTNEDVTLTVSAPGVLDNDDDADDDVLTAVHVSGPSNGVLTLNPDGSFVYTPNANFSGGDSFTYKANDGALDSNEVTDTITVNAVNDAPVADPDAYATNEDVALNVPADGVLGNDDDIDSPGLTAVQVSGPSNGVLTLNPDGSFVYTPNANFNGDDSFTYKANDGALDSNEVTVTITVNAVNDAPVADPDAYATNEDVALNVPADGVLGNDDDIDSAGLTAVLATGPSNGVLTLNGDGSFVYTPNANFNGGDSFTYKANDGALDSNEVTVTITVNAVNDAPVADPDAYATNEDVALNVPADGVLGNDGDIDSLGLTVVQVSGPGNGVLTLNPDGSFVYTPNANFNGGDSFTYKASDGALDSNEVTVSITVKGANDAPVAVEDSYSTDEDVTLNIPAPGLLANDTDDENDALSAALVSGPSFGVLDLNGDGSFSYQPFSNFFGDDAFAYTASDATGTSAQVQVTVAVASDGLIEVNSTTDTDDGVCDWQHCSLREAINLANNTPSTNSIVFEIPDTDPGLEGASYVIPVQSALPTITDPVVIDGTTQVDGEMVLDGGNGDYDGLVLAASAGGSTIRGLVIRNFGRDGIRIEGDLNDVAGSGGHTITGNTITGNGGSGVTIINAANNHITGNDISGNGGPPIDLGNDGPTANDPGDLDTGANFVQNYPELYRAVGVPAQVAGDPDTLQIVGALNSQPGSYDVEFFLSPACDAGGQTLLNPEPLSVTIAEGTTEIGFAANIGVAGDVEDLLDYGVRAIATDANGNSSEANNCIHVSYGNDVWTNPFEQSLAQSSSSTESATESATTSFSISQYLDTLGQSRWYRLKVTANSRIKFDLTDLPANYNLAVYKDVEAAYQELIDGAQNLNELGAEVASDPLNPSAATADAFRTAQTAGSALNGSALNGSALNGSALNGSALNGSALNGSALNGSALNGSALNGSALNGSALNALAVNGSALNGSALNGSALNGDELARVNSSALARTLIAVSAAEGTSPESVEINTWNNAGYIYLRVWGSEGAFDSVSAFTVTTTVTPGVCEIVSNATLPATSLAAQAGGYETLILADWSRLYDSALTGFAFDQELQNKLNQLVAAEAGVVVDVGQDARVAAANALADANPDCSFGKNLVAEAIQAVVDDYRSQNPVKYVVIVGNDDIIPFYRYPDNALLGPEAQYFVPNRFGTSSYAALRQNFLLTQDQYGSTTCISLKDNCFPIPQIPVGRLVEEPGDMKAVIDAYLNGGEVLSPDAALVTGYDFLEDASLKIRDELAAGVPTVDGDLIDPQTPGPLALAEAGLAWTATDLIDKLHYDAADSADIDFDMVFLAGHFASATALAGDYKTTVLTTDLPDDMTNKLVYSAGCHVSHNSVNWHNINGTTLEPDWAQAFASKGATLIGGTGYQYGDTDFLEYSERLYLYFTEELGKQLDGSGTDVKDIAIGDALVAAKQRYLRETPLLRGIHEKTLLVSTIYGLPMRKVNLPSRPIASPGDASVIEGGDLSGVPGNPLGLQVAAYTHVSDLEFRPEELKSIDDPDTVIQSGYWLGDGVVANPGEPVVPVERVNVTPPDASLALRGVGLTGACYSDEVLSERIPLTGAPATEASSAHIRFYFDRFIPEQPWSENYFGALIDPASSNTTSLDVMAVQYRSDANSLPEFVYTERKFSSMEFRLYYNDAISSDPAMLAPPPTIVNVSSAYDESTGADFDVTVAADANSSMQRVWVLWTDALDNDNVAQGCGPGEKRWNELTLVQDGADASVWSGNLGLGLSQAEVADRVRFIVFAVGEAGGMSWATNQGLLYTPGGAADRNATSLTLDTPGSDSGPVGATVTARALLRDESGSPLANRNIVFGLAQQTRIGVTGADGRATVELPIFGVPGEHAITASFPGSTVYAPSTAAPQAFTIQQQSTTLALGGGPNEDAVFVATLVDGTTPDPNILVEQTIFFHFTDEDGVKVTRTAITGLLGEARLGRGGIVDGIGDGTHTVVTEFKGSPSYSGTESNAVKYTRKQPLVDVPDIVLFLPTLSARSQGLAGLAGPARSDAESLHVPFVTSK